MCKFLIMITIISQVDDSPGEFSYEKCKWYWGCMSRTDCADKLRTEGSLGNFVVRMNANGHYVMSLWCVCV